MGSRVKLEEVCEQITDGKHGDCVDQPESGFYFLSCKDVLNGALHYESARQITEADFRETDRRTRLAANDILITNSGTIGRMALVRDHPRTRQTTFQKSVAILKPNLDRVTPRFLYYALCADRDRLVAFAGGTAQKNLLLRDLRAYTVMVPAITVQNRIADILSAYDDLIENNTRRIQILEEMAQRLYREWFVHFRFPGHQNVPLVDSEFGAIPEGWSAQRLETQYRMGSGGTPSRKVLSYFGGTIPWVKTQELQNGFIFRTDEAITEEGLNKSSAKVYPRGSLLLAMYGATIGKLAILDVPAACNQACCAFVPTSQPYSSEYLYLTLLERQSDILSLRMGAAQQNISQEAMRGFLIACPPDSILGDFNLAVQPLFRLIALLSRKNANLRATRDLLLPKLISGEITVTP